MKDKILKISLVVSIIMTLIFSLGLIYVPNAISIQYALLAFSMTLFMAFFYHRQ